jgi:hypothetical protein
MMKLSSAKAFALVLVLASCGGEGASTTTGADGVTTTASGGATTSTAPQDSPIAADMGLATMVILTPEEGVGERPDLAWEPVEGATMYRVTVLGPDGTLYWGWAGEETSVPLGGFPRLEDAASGPRVVSGMTWTVVALDGDLVPVAVGGPASLSR